MKKEITQYLESKGFQVHKIIMNIPWNIPEDQIFLAIHDIYEEIENGRRIRDIELVREIWRKAYDYHEKEINRRLKFVHNIEFIKHLWRKIFSERE